MKLRRIIEDEFGDLDDQDEFGVTCPMCGGDGKETCNNPDHMNSHLGCPVCGHDPEHKVINGGDCELCDGLGCVSRDTLRIWEHGNVTR